MKKIIGDGFLQLKSNDILKGFIMAVLSVLITWIGQSLESGSFTMDKAAWILQIKIALGAGIAYIIKNFFTNSEDKFLKKENEAAK